MAIRKSKKIRKRRGSRTHGYGRVTGHYKSGHRGGVGNAGRKDHHWILSIKKGLIKPRGFTSHHPSKKVVAINLGVLEIIKDDFIEKGFGTVANGVYSFNLGELGYTKLLGKGIIKTKFEISGVTTTERAKMKIEALGGKIHKEEENE